METLRFVFLGLCCLALSALYTVPVANAAETINIRVATYPPQYYKDQNGNWTGIDVELARALVIEAGFTPDFIDAPWSRALEEMKSGRLHLMTTLSKTPERSTYMYWIGPERESKMALVVKKKDQSLQIESLDDLITLAKSKNIKIGMQQDIYYGQPFATSIIERDFSQHFESVTDAKLNPRKNLAGRIIGFFEDKLTMQYQIETNKDYAGLAVHSFTMNTENLYFGISRKVPVEWIRRLESAYERLVSSGELERIRNHEWW